MESMLTTSGYGDGDGYGYGYSSVHGSGDGYGSGGGFGSGFGYGSGHGSGDGYGCGSGDGYGIAIGEIADYDVYLIREFRVVVVGCQAHTIDEWERRWREIAAEEEVDVDETEVERLFAIVRERLE